jgi:N-acetylglucosamine kinase-like BadF-type ATPase
MQAAFYGMAGADRPSDQRHIRRWLGPLSPAKKFRLAADPIPMIRLASPDGSGIAAVAGTGGNCIGVDAAGRECSVGGWIGSWVGGGDIGMKLINAAVEAQDGRGPRTLLVDLLCRKYRLKEPTDLLDWVYVDAPKGRQLNNVELAPLAFEAAGRGDRVARALLAAQGHELFRMAAQVRKSLFKAGRPLVVVMGGSLLQHARPPLMRLAFEKEFRKFHPRVKFVTPDRDPVYGALLLAYDLAGVAAPEQELLGAKV